MLRKYGTFDEESTYTSDSLLNLPDEILIDIFNRVLVSLKIDYEKKTQNARALLLIEPIPRCYRNVDEKIANAHQSIIKEKIRLYQQMIMLASVCLKFNNLIMNEQGDCAQRILYHMSDTLYFNDPSNATLSSVRILAYAYPNDHLALLRNSLLLEHYDYAKEWKNHNNPFHNENPCDRFCSGVMASSSGCLVGAVVGSLGTMLGMICCCPPFTPAIVGYAAAGGAAAGSMTGCSIYVGNRLCWDRCYDSRHYKHVREIEEKIAEKERQSGVANLRTISFFATPDELRQGIQLLSQHNTRQPESQRTQEERERERLLTPPVSQTM